VYVVSPVAVVEAPTPAAARRQQHRRRLDLNPPAISAWTLAFALVMYLALRGGGYDLVVRSQVGVLVWWVVLLGALAGVLPARIGAGGWIAVGLLAGFALWTGLAIGWSESAEQSVIELGRIAAYLGVLVLAISLQGRTAARHTVNGLASAIGLVTMLAVLSRLHPQAFPAGHAFQFLGPSSARKLSYPLNYWNALADFAAMGVPLLLAAAIGARRIAWQALAAATLPLSAVCVYLTISRGGVIALGVGVAVFLLLAPRRLEAVATLLLCGVGAAILLRATAQRTAVTSGVSTRAAIHQGTQLLWLIVVVCLGVALVQVAIALAARHLDRPDILTPGRRATTKRALALTAVALITGVAAGVPSRLAHTWHDFKQPSGVVVPTNDSSLFSRLQAANGNSRYQFWQSALHANATHPWRGIGPGTFQFWWAQHATANGFIRNAHSLYFETLAETGIIGLALLGGLLLWFVAVAVGRALREPPTVRLWLAGASASLAVFLFSAAVEWVWQLAAIAAIALMLGAVIVAGRGDADEQSAAPEYRSRAWGARLVPRVVLALVSIAGLGAVLVPLAGQIAIRDSQTAAAEGHVGAALQDSLAAQRLQPYSSTAHLQEALVLEAAGELAPASAAARVATSDSPTDWTTWLTLARIDARRGATRAALVELRQARRLNPRSSLFQHP
jgi:O-antigen ligase/polysaccharide polymerase Wzy-like membrane protein